MMIADYFLKDRSEYNEDTIPDPDISVIMPTFQRAEGGMLSRALRSVLNQSFRNFELIVVDDGSFDGSDRTVHEWLKKDRRIRLIRYEKNSGLPALRADEGVLAAKGKYIAFAFDDDVWYENALGDLYGVISTDESIDAVYGNDQYYKQQGGAFELFLEAYGDQDFSPRAMRIENIIPCNAFLIKKISMIGVGLYTPHPVIRRMADWDFWLRAADRLRIVHVPVLCGEMYEMTQSSIPRLGHTDLDLLVRFSTFYHGQHPPIRTREDLAQFPIDDLPDNLTDAFSRTDIVSLIHVMKTYVEQTGIGLSKDPAAHIHAASDRKIKAGLFEIGEGFGPDLLDGLSRRGSFRFLSEEMPLREIRKSNVLLFDGFSKDLLSSPYHRKLRFSMNYVCLDKPVKRPEGFEDIHVLNPGAEGVDGVVKKIADSLHQKDFVPVDLSKMTAMSDMLNDVTSIIDHAETFWRWRRNPIVRHIRKILKEKT